MTKSFLSVEDKGEEIPAAHQIARGYEESYYMNISNFFYFIFKQLLQSWSLTLNGETLWS